VTAPGIVDVLRHRTFRLLVIGVTTSRIGDAMTFVVITWLALNLGGAKAVGLVVFVGGCVAPFSGPLIGYLLDRLGLRLLMLVDNVARGLLMVVLAALVHTDRATLGHLVVFAILSTLLSPATELGQEVAVPVLLKSRELDAANRLLSATWDISAWIGPAVAGFGIELIGSAAVLLIDASTFFVMALVAATMPGRPDRADEGEGEQPGTFVGRLLQGFAILWRLRPVAVLTLVGLTNLFLGGMMEVFLPAFNKLTLHQGASEYGLLVSIAGVMCLVGTLALTPLVTQLGYGPGLVLVLVTRGLAVLPLAFVGSWALAVVFVAIAAIPDGSYFPISRTVQQRLIPASVRGRVQGAKTMLGILGFPLGGAVGGLLLASFGPPAVAAVIGLGYLPLALAVMLTPQVMRHVAPDEPRHDEPAPKVSAHEPAN
jgi:MFS transporter, DHA3 family, macrolide efflux protein